jgi:hypothetical protein
MTEHTYETDRIQQWRKEKLNDSFSETLREITEDGYQLWSVFDNDHPTLGFSYSVGVFDTSAHPELISIGLPPKTASSALNSAIGLMRSGINLIVGRHKNVVGEVEVEFHPVDPKWLHHVMLRTDWYYSGKDVPVLQLIYPDLENHFQGEDGFQEFFRQPLLSRDQKESTLERDFWVNYDRNGKQ